MRYFRQLDPSESRTSHRDFLVEVLHIKSLLWDDALHTRPDANARGTPTTKLPSSRQTD